MVVRTPWQFGERSTSQQTFLEESSQFPKVKVQHPLSRLSDPRDINVRGTSRLGSR